MGPWSHCQDQLPRDDESALVWRAVPYGAVLGKQPQSAPSPLSYAVGACMTRSAQASAATCITSPVEGTLPPAATMRAICSRHTTFCCSQENARSSALLVTLERESEKLFWSENVPRERSTKTISAPLALHRVSKAVVCSACVNSLRFRATFLPSRLPRRAPEKLRRSGQIWIDVQQRGLGLHSPATRQRAEPPAMAVARPRFHPCLQRQRKQTRHWRAVHSCIR